MNKIYRWTKVLGIQKQSTKWSNKKWPKLSELFYNPHNYRFSNEVLHTKPKKTKKKLPDKTLYRKKILSSNKI